MSQRNHPANQAECVGVCAYGGERERERECTCTQPTTLIIFPQTATTQGPCSEMKRALGCIVCSCDRSGPESLDRICYLPEIPQDKPRCLRMLWGQPSFLEASSDGAWTPASQSGASQLLMTQQGRAGEVFAYQSISRFYNLPARL